jgi:hypothetical protein
MKLCVYDRIFYGSFLDQQTEVCVASHIPNHALTLANVLQPSGSIKQLIEDITSNPGQTYFHYVSLGDPIRQTIVKDTVLMILGTWTMMQSYFIPKRGQERQLLIAYCWNNGILYSENSCLDQALPELLNKS